MLEDNNSWIKVETKLPPPETPVLAIVNGIDIPVVLELRWEICNPMLESYYEDFLYWDEPNDDGKDYEGLVAYWRYLPDPPKLNVDIPD
mgnify:CR=1 FL=1